MDHGLIRAIATVLDQSCEPLTVKRITELVDQRCGIPFVSKTQNIGALLAMEIHRQHPRWQRVGRGVYTATTKGLKSESKNSSRHSDAH